MRLFKLSLLGIFLVAFWSCSDLGDEVKGCMDSNACNYDTYATISEDLCLQLDCNSECGGDAVTDSCGTCAGTIMNSSECECPDGQTKDCANECGGTAVLDECGECDGDNSSCVNYSTEIQPILSSNCTICHGGAGGLTLTSYTNLISGAVVIAGNSQGSLLIKKLRGTAPLAPMPQGEDPLDESTINLIEIWIDEGARNN